VRGNTGVGSLDSEIRIVVVVSKSYGLIVI
jgi:hypothetical protein